MQQFLVKNGCSIAARGGQQLPSQRSTAAFKPAVKGNKVLATRRFSSIVRATAAPATAQASPFAAVNSEAALFAILKAGAAGGKVCRSKQCTYKCSDAHNLITVLKSSRSIIWKSPLSRKKTHFSPSF